MTVFARSRSHICRSCRSTSSRDCPPSASTIRNSLPARTSSTPAKPSELSECWIAFPCGSRTDGLSSTITVAFMASDFMPSGAPHPGASRLSLSPLAGRGWRRRRRVRGATRHVLVDQRLIELHVHMHDRPIHVRPEDPLLLDALRRATPAIPRGPVGGDDDQRRAGVMRFDDGGEELRDRRPRGRHDRRRRLQNLGAAEGEEGRRALVDERPDADAGRDRQHRQQRRVARAGADAEVGRAARAGVRDRLAGALNVRHAGPRPRRRR